MLNRLRNAGQFASNTAALRAARAGALSGAARTAVANSTGAGFARRGAGAANAATQFANATRRVRVSGS